MADFKSTYYTPIPNTKYYKDHIVGKARDYYFIFDECTKSPQIFEDEAAWQRAMDNQDLSPLYTRWLTIGDAPETFLFALVLSAYIIVPVLVIVLVLVAYLTISRQLTWSRHTRIVTAAIVLPVALFFLFQLNIRSF